MARQPRASRAGAAANKARGEHSLMLGGTAYRLRPSHEAISAIEAGTDLGLIPLARRCDACNLSMEDLGFVVAELIKAGAAPGDELTANVSAQRIEELIWEEGLSPVFAVLTFLLLDASTGGRELSGEAKAVATPK